jgi:ferrous iron transport protein A
MTLWDLPASGGAVLQGYIQSAPDKYRERMEELGFVIGQSVSCLRITPFGGPRVYSVGGSIYSLDRELAEQMMISVTEVR